MIPEGFVSWESPLRPEDDDHIAVLHANHALARGVARELARLYGESIFAWRRENGFPPSLDGADWRRFPDELPAAGQRVEVAFVDTIGWRALTVRGMTARRFEPNVTGTATYRAGHPFGVFLQREAMRGLHAVDDARRWSVFAWREMGAYAAAR